MTTLLDESNEFENVDLEPVWPHSTEDKGRIVDIGNYTDIFLNNLTVEVEFEFYP